MTLNIAIDEQLARQAQQVAESRGMSLDQLIRRYLQDLTTQSRFSPGRSAREMRGIVRGIDTTVERDPDRV